MHGDDIYVRLRLRVERGQKGEWDDEETSLFDGDEPTRNAWVATPFPPAGAFVIEYGHILADVEHLLLQDQVFVGDAETIDLTSTVRLEGHPFHGFAGPLLKAGRVGHGVHRITNLVIKQAHEVVEIYQDPVQRRAFAHAVRHPHLLTPVMQRSLLFLVLLSSLWLWIAGLTILALVWPGIANAWNVAFSLYFASLATNLFVPIPVEPLALASTGTLGAVGVAVACGLGKMVGAWIIYTLGPVLRKAMAKLEAGSLTTRRVMDRASRFARRYGYAALGAMLAVPFSPFDIIPVYLFATLGLRVGPFLAAVFIGFGLRVFVVVALGDVLLRFVVALGEMLV